ncbi:MAG: PrsW family intramembrane metalloprotease [Blastocatellia bacterium]|nr:PrsW family intramembrane metalloprotease [Blastocatellia bacterium]
MSELPAIVVLFLSFLPCLIWLVFFYVQDWYDREPLWLIGLTFVFGIISTVGALVGNEVGGAIVRAIFGRNNIVANFVEYFFVVGPVEETVKMLAVLVLAYRRPEFDEPVDGVIYSAAAALGFAAAENVLYVGQFGIGVLTLRGPMSNAGHAFFSAFWGLAMSRAKAAPNIGGKKFQWIASGILVAALLHGFYDFVLSLRLPGGVAVLFILVFMAGMFAVVEFMTLRAVAKSPRREGTQLLQLPVPCSNCGTPGLPGMPCVRCHAIITQSVQNEARFCLRCGNLSQPGAVQCRVCGMSLLKAPTAPPQTDRPHFVRIYPNGAEEVAYVIDQIEASIGKTLDNPFVIEDDSVSKRHARVFWHPNIGAHVIQDLGSTNGTFVNGQRVSEAAVYNGFEIRLGQTRFVYRATWRA